MQKLKPSQFVDINPIASIFRNSERETILRNALIISKREGDTFGLTKELYELHRKQDGNYSREESKIADEVLPYVATAIELSTVSKAYTDRYVSLSSSLVLI